MPLRGPVCCPSHPVEPPPWVPREAQSPLDQDPGGEGPPLPQMEGPDGMRENHCPAVGTAIGAGQPGADCLEPIGRADWSVIQKWGCWPGEEGGGTASSRATRVGAVLPTPAGVHMYPCPFPWTHSRGLGSGASPLQKLGSPGAAVSRALLDLSPGLLKTPTLTTPPDTNAFLTGLLRPPQTHPPKQHGPAVLARPAPC